MAAHQDDLSSGNDFEDWMKAKTWLSQKEVTQMSAKVPDLPSINSEYELYNYLKDGTELCRMIGLVTKGKALEGIVYRPNNISTLEEKNISLFIKYVESELKLHNVFGKEGSEVFHKFGNFYKALSGLAKVSQKIKRNYKIPSFNSKGRPTQLENYEDNEYKSNTIHENREETEKGCLDDKLIVKEEKALSNLDFAVEELINYNDRFISDVLFPFKEFEKKNTNDLLARQFFPVFKLDKLLEVHEEMKHMFEKVPYCYKGIGNIFDKFKDDFIIYCTIAAKNKLAMDFFANQMSENPDVRKCIEDMEKEAKGNMADPNKFCGIKDLTMMIPSYVMKWPVVLESVRMKAYKEKSKGSFKKAIEQGARQAKDIMTDVMKHMDRVSSDYQYITAMKEFKNEIISFPYENLTQFGILSKELNDVSFSIGPDSGNFNQFDLLIFNDYIVALELRPKEEFIRGVFGTKKVVLQERERKFSKCFKIKEMHSIKTMKQGGNTLLFVKSFKDLREDPERCFVLKQTNDVIEATENDLKRLQKASEEKILKGSKHPNHTCFKYQAKGKEESCHNRCGECNELLLGLLYTGVECETCGKLFHKNCFSVMKGPLSEDAEPDMEDPEYYLLYKRNDLTMEDFYREDMSMDDAQEILSSRKEGTFLMIGNSMSGHMLVTKPYDTNNLTSVDIKKVIVHRETLFYLEKGTSAPTILELINIHRRSYQLYIPISVEVAENDDEEPMIEVEKLKEPEPEPEDFGNLDDDHLPYFWGDLKAAQADAKLKNQEPGTFLLRQNEGIFKISWKSFSCKLMHTHIKQVGDYYSVDLAAKKNFDTLHELVMFYQQQSRSFMNSLGSPLKIPTVKKEFESARRNEPFSLRSFHGTMDKHEAENKLQKESDGTYLLRQSYIYNNYTITYKKSNTIYHLTIRTLPTESRISFKVYHEHIHGGETVANSLRGIINNLKAVDIISTPLVAREPQSYNVPLAQSYAQLWKKNAGVSTAQEKAMLHAEEEDIPDEKLNESQTTENTDDEAQTIQFKEEQLSKKEAEGLLWDKPFGSWIIYYNKSGNERITVKKINKMEHIIIYNIGKGYALKKIDEPAPLHRVIQRLKDKKIIKNQITDFDVDDFEEDDQD